MDTSRSPADSAGEIRNRHATEWNPEMRSAWWLRGVALFLVIAWGPRPFWQFMAAWIVALLAVEGAASLWPILERREVKRREGRPVLRFVHDGAFGGGTDG